MKLYINGQVVTSTPASGSIGTSANDLGIGREPASADSFFDGQIDDVKIFNYALTNQQILTEYNQGAVHFGN
jgi:hypothetical protein